MKSIIITILAVSSFVAVQGLSPEADQWFMSATDKVADLIKDVATRFQDVFGDDYGTLQALKERANLTPNCSDLVKAIEKYATSPRADLTSRLVENFNIMMAPCRRLDDSKGASCTGNVLNSGFGYLKNLITTSLRNKFKNFPAIAEFKKAVEACSSG